MGPCRQHAVIQFRKDTEDVYVYDLNSTHGTFVNKKALMANAYRPLKVPYIDCHTLIAMQLLPRSYCHTDLQHAADHRQQLIVTACAQPAAEYRPQLNVTAAERDSMRTDSS